MHSLPRPITANNVDGTTNHHGNITHYATLTLRIGHLVRPMHLLITHLGREDFIFGLPWFRRTNPQIDWTTGEVNLRKLTHATRLAQAKEPAEKRSLQDAIPEKYHEFLSIFDEAESQRFPPSRSSDHAINLKPDFIPKNFRPYPIPLSQHKQLDEFIDANLKHGYI